jgi:hypothetical protein
VCLIPHRYSIKTMNNTTHLLSHLVSWQQGRQVETGVAVPRDMLSPVKVSQMHRQGQFRLECGLPKLSPPGSDLCVQLASCLPAREEAGLLTHRCVICYVSKQCTQTPLPMQRNFLPISSMFQDKRCAFLLAPSLNYSAVLIVAGEVM